MFYRKNIFFYLKLYDVLGISHILRNAINIVEMRHYELFYKIVFNK